MIRAHNFSAGPAALPESVLRSAAEEMLNYKDTGVSILEMSHRSAPYKHVIEQAEETLRTLLAIPSTYHVLFLQGGATLQFSSVPLNLMRTGRAGYVVSGHFSKRACDEATRFGNVCVLASSAETNFDRIPHLGTIDTADLDYVHICQNNTIYGTMFTELPETGATPLVADLSSCFLAFPVDITRYGLIYAGAQKNAGPAGVTIVIVRDDLVGTGPALDCCPTSMSYRTQVDARSLYNTPNTFGIYLSGKVFTWIHEQGGLASMQECARKKSQLLYEYIDESHFFHGTASPESRSWVNVTFRTPSDELDALFCAEAERENIVGIRGHRKVGGMRASLYNAVSYESTVVLRDFMARFEREHLSERSRSL